MISKILLGLSTIVLFGIIIYLNAKKKDDVVPVSLCFAGVCSLFVAVMSENAVKTKGIKQYLNNEVVVDTISIYKDGRLNEIEIHDRERLITKDSYVNRYIYK